jgi:hypothetical protein
MAKDASFSSNDLHFLSVVLKLGLAVVVGGWFFGTWWICCSSHALLGSHHEVFLEHEALEHLRGNAVQRTRELNEKDSNFAAAAIPVHLNPPIVEVKTKAEHEELKALINSNPVNPIVSTDQIPSSLSLSSALQSPSSNQKYNFNPPWSVNKTMEGTIFMSIAACEL